MMKKGFIKISRRILRIKPKPRKRIGFSEEIKRQVLRLQRYECATFRCHNKKFLEFDHIRGRSDNSIRNCQALCPTCHRHKTYIDRRKAQLDRKKTKPDSS